MNNFILFGVAFGFGILLRELHDNKRHDERKTSLPLGRKVVPITTKDFEEEVKKLSSEDIYIQLEMYARNGPGTASYESVFGGKSVKAMHPYTRAICFVDCMDAGMPYGDMSEVFRCHALKNELEKRGVD